MPGGSRHVRLMCALLGSDKETTCGGDTAAATASLATAGVRGSVCVCVGVSVSICVNGRGRLIGSNQPQGRLCICYFNSRPHITWLSLLYPDINRYKPREKNNTEKPLVRCYGADIRNTSSTWTQTQCEIQPLTLQHAHQHQQYSTLCFNCEWIFQKVQEYIFFFILKTKKSKSSLFKEIKALRDQSQRRCSCFFCLTLWLRFSFGYRYFSNLVPLDPR